MRISDSSLTFASVDNAAENQMTFEPYVVRSGMSMAANLRQAFGESALLQRGYRRAYVMIDTPALMIPEEEFSEESVGRLYHHVFLGYDKDAVMYVRIPDLSVVAAFSVNKDLKLVITDHFNDVEFCPLGMSVWHFFLRKDRNTSYRRLYGYFHDRKLEMFGFDRNRFEFHNSFPVKHVKDAVYFLLYVWKQLGLDALKDELVLAGDIEEKNELRNELRKFLAKPYFMNPSAEFNRAPISQIKGMPLDIMTLFYKERL